MHHRRFASTRAEVSEIGLGCWQLGGADWGDVSDEQAMSVLRASVEGASRSSTPPTSTGAGRSESLIGRFLKADKPKKIFVATKLGRFPEPGGAANLTPESFRAHTEASLSASASTRSTSRSSTASPDVLKSGGPFQWLRDLKKAGKIRHFARASNRWTRRLWCVRQEGVASLQVIFNIFRQKPLTELFREAKHRGVALIVRLPLASGLLSGKMSRGTQFAANDHRNYNRDGQAFNVGETFAGLTFEKGIELTDALKPLVPPAPRWPRWPCAGASTTTR